MSPAATTKVLDYRFCPRKKARQSLPLSTTKTQTPTVKGMHSYWSDPINILNDKQLEKGYKFLTPFFPVSASNEVFIVSCLCRHLPGHVIQIIKAQKSPPLTVMMEVMYFALLLNPSGRRVLQADFFKISLCPRNLCHYCIILVIFLPLNYIKYYPLTEVFIYQIFIQHLNLFSCKSLFLLILVLSFPQSDLHRCKALSFSKCLYVIPKELHI